MYGNLIHVQEMKNGMLTIVCLNSTILSKVVPSEVENLKMKANETRCSCLLMERITCQVVFKFHLNWRQDNKENETCEQGHVCVV